jgi:hypothetical protein
MGITSRVIDSLARDGNGWPMSGHRYDATLRKTMWLDAFLSVAVALLAILASPLVAMLGLAQGAVFGLGVAAIVCALLLAGCGAVTGVVLMRRMAAGNYLLPERLSLPLPSGMRPPT